MKITLYTKPGCQPCRATKRWLDNREVPYESKDVTLDPADIAAVKELGYEGVPVVVVNNGDNETEIHWTGFHPDNLKKYTINETSK